jgi:hypothetical protein
MMAQMRASALPEVLNGGIWYHMVYSQRQDSGPTLAAKIHHEVCEWTPERRTVSGFRLRRV